jgi:hypothetical protein
MWDHAAYGPMLVEGGWVEVCDFRQTLTDMNVPLTDPRAPDGEFRPLLPGGYVAVEPADDAEEVDA